MTDKRIQQIKTLGGSVLFECDIPEGTPSGLAVRYAMEKATQERADLRDADLRGAYLRDADLRGAYLRGAYLGGADLRDADLRGAYLRGAYLGGADLRDADLRGANLRGADLRGKKLVGDRPFIQIGPIGSRGDYLLAFITDGGVIVKAGCFEGSIEEFENACADTHGDNEPAKEYAAALVLIRSHAELWAPKEAA